MYMLRRSDSKYFVEFDLKKGKLVLTSDCVEGYVFKNFEDCIHIRNELNKYDDCGFTFEVEDLDNK